MATQADYYEVYDLEFVTGDYYYRRILFEDPDPDSPDPENPVMVPRDWTGWTARAQIRANTKRETEITAVIDITLGEDSPQDGFVILELQEEESAKCLKAGGWDLEITNPSGKPETVMGGKVLPFGDYTHD
jgi:hypothetical protein